VRFSVSILLPVLILAGCGGGGGGGAGSSGGASTPPSTSAAPITSEADSLLHLDQLRSMGFRGSGVRVGVISTGVSDLKVYQNAGVLPNSIYVSQNFAGSLDEGSWMLELVHQHAPDALLGFCDGSDLDFDGCVKDLAQNFGADIIVDDLLFSGQFYPDATAHLVGQLEAANDKFLFIHLSGNEQNGGYWLGGFTPITATIGSIDKNVLDFGAASGKASDPYNAVTIVAGARLALMLSWNDAPHGGTANHSMSAYLMDAESNILAQDSNQNDPNLLLQYTNNTGASQTVRLAVSLDAGSAATLAVQVTEGYRTCNIECDALTYSTSGLAGGSVGDFEDALVVGATSAKSPQTLEAWSNHGPFRLDFSATPDAAAADGFDYTRLSTPLLLNKPDLVTPDCVTTPFSNNGKLVNEQFCGTSAAVPSAAAAAALLLSAGFNRAQVLKSLRGTAHPLGAASWDASYGFGLLDAAAAYASGGK
jgi:Subtilase family